MSWTESDAAHKLIRSKNKKQRDMARKSSIKSKASRMTQKDAEMTPDIDNYPGLPVVPDSYGTNSALSSGQGVPQWYGSAESFEDIKTASDLVDFAESNGGSLHIEIADSLARYSEYISFVEPDAEAMDFVFLDGTMATCNKDDDLNTFVVAYEGDEGETFEAMASHDPSGDDRDDAKAQFKMTYPGFTMSNSSLQYLVYQSGSSNKYHMFWLAQDKSGGWYAFSGYGRIGYAARMIRITGPTTQETAMRAMQSKINKKVGKGYTNVSRDFGMSAEEVQAGLPVIPDSYGTNSALESGQGVPQWYGSADTEDENWDRTEYEYKELEIAKPFRTAFMASLGFVVAPLALLAGLAFAFGDE